MAGGGYSPLYSPPKSATDADAVLIQAHINSDLALLSQWALMFTVDIYNVQAT